MLKKITSVLLLSLIVFFACSVNPSKVDDKYAKKFAKNITYVKDERTGLCFGIVATRKTADTDQSGLGMACVPCDSVKHLLIMAD